MSSAKMNDKIKNFRVDYAMENFSEGKYARFINYMPVMNDLDDVPDCRSR